MHKVFKNNIEFINSCIKSNDKVLDVGFWGQGVKMDDENWPHRMLQKVAGDVYGIDIVFDEKKFPDSTHYKKQSAENFSFDTKFNVIFISDVIEHLSNPGLFLNASKKYLTPSGKLIIITENCFNLFNLTNKLMHFDPVVNRDHTAYFNIKTLKQLLGKVGWEVTSVDFLYKIGGDYKESWKKKILNLIYKILSFITPKYLLGIVVTAQVKK